MKTIAIQVVPFIEHVGGAVTPQLEGPTDATTGWAVYERKEDGTVDWYADTGNELHARFIGNKLAIYLSVEFEPQPWKTVEDTRTYKIVRRRFAGENSTIKTGLTLAEAQKHCSDPQSSSETATHPDEPGVWFDSFTQE